jgi:cellobiose-specific phosphotransferase system component IIB
MKKHNVLLVCGSGASSGFMAANIRKAAEAKVENGTLTVTDMLREITAENLARQTKALHEVQLLMNIWNLKYTLNN